MQPVPDAPCTGIVVLNYHQPADTSACIASLLAREPDTSRILWVENDAAATRDEVLAHLAGAPFPWVEVAPEDGPMPPPGTVGVIFCADNLGYAGGNNVGLRLLHRHGVPFGWVLNNDTLLVAGSSVLLAEAARARPEVGAWGTVILTDFHPVYFGGILQLRDFAIRHARSPEALRDPLAFVSGCSLFMPLGIAAEAGFLPEDYFLYYEDPSFSMRLRQLGYAIDGLWTVTIRHLESLSTGRRSPLMEFYSHRNRWYFIERFFPEHLARQKARIVYTLQKYLLRGKLTSIYVEWAAYRDYRHGQLGRTSRVFSRAKRNP